MDKFTEALKSGANKFTDGLKGGAEMIGDGFKAGADKVKGLIPGQTQEAQAQGHTPTTADPNVSQGGRDVPDIEAQRQ